MLILHWPKVTTKHKEDGHRTAQALQFHKTLQTSTTYTFRSQNKVCNNTYLQNKNNIIVRKTKQQAKTTEQAIKNNMYIVQGIASDH